MSYIHKLLIKKLTNARNYKVLTVRIVLCLLFDAFTTLSVRCFRSVGLIPIFELSNQVSESQNCNHTSIDLYDYSSETLYYFVSVFKVEYIFLSWSYFIINNEKYFKQIDY